MSFIRCNYISNHEHTVCIAKSDGIYKPIGPMTYLVKLGAFYEPEGTKHRAVSLHIAATFLLVSPASPLRGCSVLRCLNRKESRPKPSDGLNMRTAVLLQDCKETHELTYCDAMILPQKSCNIFMGTTVLVLLELQVRFWSQKPNVLTNQLPHFPPMNKHLCIDPKEDKNNIKQVLKLIF